MQEMIAKLFESMEKLRAAIDKRYEVSEKRAHAEYCYRETLGREMALAKAEGMAATALYLLIQSPLVQTIKQQKQN